MRIKRKNGLKVAAITIALLLCLALAIGITGAFYQAKRQAIGTLSMDQGIIIDYKGFGKTPDEGIWTRENKTTFLLFDETNAQPGQNIPVNAAGIRANEESVNFYARVKLSYKFYNGETPVELADATKLIKTSSSFWANSWVDGGSSDGYYYYATGTTLNKFNKGTQTFVDLFATDAKFIIEGAGFTGADNDGESGGFKIDETTSINKIEVYLTLETLQGDATAEQAKALGWEITTGGTEGENVVKLTPEDYTSTATTDNATGDYTPSQTFVGKNPKYAFKFALNDTDKTATITGPVGKPTELDIPSKIIVKEQEYTTTSIENKAFKTCISLTSIDIPDSVKSIGEWTFNGCIKLNSVTIGNGSETTIGEYAFLSCGKLQSVQIGNGVKSIGNGAFQKCRSLTSITIPDSVTSIGEFAFNETELTSITIPKGVTSIGKGAFSGCGVWNNEIVSSLSSITVEEGNTKYHSKSNCLIERASKTLIAGCKESVIPEDVTSIGDYAFYGCKVLTKITIPKGVTSIGEGAFRECSGLTSVIIPNSVESIGLQAFASCEKITSIDIPDNVISIGDEAFAYCGLESIDIPDNVISIGEYAFNGCKKLQTVTIGEQVKLIPNECFKNCTVLETVVIKGKITSIGSGAFQYCSKLTTVLLNKDSTVGISVNNLTKLEGTFNEEGIEDASGSFFKYAKQA